MSRRGGMPTPLRRGVLRKEPPSAEFHTGNQNSGNYSDGAFIAAHAAEYASAPLHCVADSRWPV